MKQLGVSGDDGWLERCPAVRWREECSVISPSFDFRTSYVDEGQGSSQRHHIQQIPTMLSTIARVRVDNDVLYAIYKERLTSIFHIAPTVLNVPPLCSRSRGTFDAPGPASLCLLAPRDCCRAWDRLRNPRGSWDLAMRVRGGGPDQSDCFGCRRNM